MLLNFVHTNQQITANKIYTEKQIYTENSIISYTSPNTTKYPPPTPKCNNNKNSDDKNYYYKCIISKRSMHAGPQNLHHHPTLPYSTNIITIILSSLFFALTFITLSTSLSSVPPQFWFLHLYCIVL